MATNDELNKGKKLLSDQAQLAGVLDNAFKSIAANISVAFEDVMDTLEGVDRVNQKIAKSYERDILGAIKKISKGLEGNIELQLKINRGQNVQKEIQQKRNNLEVKEKFLTQQILNNTLLSEKAQNKLLKQIQETLGEEVRVLDELEDQNKTRQKSKGFLEDITESLGVQLDKLDKSGFLSSLIKGDFESIAGSAKLGQAALAAVATAVLEANKSVTGISKDLGISAVQATALRLELSGAAFSANDLRVTTETILKANRALNNEFQTAAIFNKEILIGATSILDAQVMSAEATSQLAGDAARLGMSFDEAAKTQENAVNAINAQTGAQISLQTVLEDSNKVTGQIRAQLGANPEAIARAVTQAKALGFELEQIASAGKQLLDFESSISAELEAELLTGKQLNLERARLAALTGDLETLTSEISANVGDFNDFSKLNVIQQEAIAKAVGMTADQLADSLVTEENREQLLKDAIATNNTQAIQDLKRLDVQEKFEKSLMQVKGIFIDLATILSPVADLVGLIAEGFNTTIGKVGLLVGALALVRKYQLVSAVGAIFQGNAKFGPLGIAASVAGVAALLGAVSRVTKADDMAYGNNMLVTKNKGAIMLNNNDSVIAGTNLGGGINYDKMAQAMSKAQVNVTTKYNSFRAYSTTSNGGRYQSSARYETKFV